MKLNVFLDIIELLSLVEVGPGNRVCSVRPWSSTSCLVDPCLGDLVVMSVHTPRAQNTLYDDLKSNIFFEAYRITKGCEEEREYGTSLVGCPCRRIYDPNVQTPFSRGPCTVLPPKGWRH